MKNKIQEQVLKEFYWKTNKTREQKSLAQTLARYQDVNKGIENHNEDLKKAISRTIELTEKEWMNQMKVATNRFNDEFDKQKTDFKKELEEWKLGFHKLNKDLKEQKADFKKMIEDSENPYPKDIFQWNNKAKLDFNRGRFNKHCFEIVENLRIKLLKKLDEDKEVGT